MLQLSTTKTSKPQPAIIHNILNIGRDIFTQIPHLKPDAWPRARFRRTTVCFWAMARKNRTQFAILGYLASQDGTGYDIRAWLGRISTMWHESYGQIYPTLQRMTDEGLVTRTVEDGAKGSDKYMYSITGKGKKVLLEWLEEPVYFAPPRSEIMLRVYFGKHVNGETLVKQILRYKQVTQETYKRCLELDKQFVINKELNPITNHAYMTISHGIYVCRAELNWCDDMLTRLNYQTS